ncbi:plasmid segregation protein ParM domain-containing protein [Methylobacter marinus]|uniref:plasmid segregation protein ParM domain-containing protein n=1 Tax=Methylobacter marinus TaxID=34058 RepID=UPI0003694C50|nr:plasmid segregation protein ParM domain-containing protein [Methylobacter marinus]
MDELELLFSQDHAIDIGGETVDVSPVRLGELARLAKLFKGAVIEVKGTPTEIATKLLTSGEADRIIAALSVAARQDQAFIEALELDDAVRLLAAVIESNADMIKKKLMPAISQITAALSAGASASPD